MKERKPSRDSANEHAVTGAVGGAPYVCTVETDGIFGEVAKGKAVMANRRANPVPPDHTREQERQTPP